MIAAREQRKRKAGVGVGVAGIELDSTPRQCIFPRLCPFRPAEHRRKPDISSDKHRIEIDGARAGEFHQKTIAHDLEQPPRMLGDAGLDDIGPQSAEPRQRIGLIGADEAGVAHHVGGQNGGKASGGHVRQNCFAQKLRPNRNRPKRITAWQSGPRLG
jgi:hypothetical protein